MAGIRLLPWLVAGTPDSGSLGQNDPCARGQRPWVHTEEANDVLVLQVDSGFL